MKKAFKIEITHQYTSITIKHHVIYVFQVEDAYWIGRVLRLSIFGTPLLPLLLHPLRLRARHPPLLHPAPRGSMWVTVAVG